MSATSTPLWKTFDDKAQKSGPHRSVHWVKKKIQTFEERVTQKDNKPQYQTAAVYTGDWKNNLKHGFGSQTWSNGNKYEGEWQNSKRHGHGTYWILENASQKTTSSNNSASNTSNKSLSATATLSATSSLSSTSSSSSSSSSSTKKVLRKVYHGQWKNDLKDGLGVYHYVNGDRYEGYWLCGQRHGQGTLFLANGDIYVGEWSDDKRAGWGTLTKSNGDQYEGQWLNDKREGQGQFFYRQTGKVFDGEWINDIPKCGVYTDLQLLPPDQLAQVLNPLLPSPLPPSLLPNAQKARSQLPSLELVNPDGVLLQEIEKIQVERAAARAAPFIPLDQLFNEAELDSLRNIFSTADASGSGHIKAIELRGLYDELGVSVTEVQFARVLLDIDKTTDQTVTFAEFVKSLYLLQSAHLVSDASAAQADTFSLEHQS